MNINYLLAVGVQKERVNRVLFNQVLSDQTFVLLLQGVQLGLRTLSSHTGGRQGALLVWRGCTPARDATSCVNCNMWYFSSLGHFHIPSFPLFVSLGSAGKQEV